MSVIVEEYTPAVYLAFVALERLVLVSLLEKAITRKMINMIASMVKSTVYISSFNLITIIRVLEFINKTPSNSIII